DTTRSEDRLLVPSFSSPAPRAVPPGAFTAHATRPFNSYPHDPPQSGNAPVLLTHISFVWTGQTAAVGALVHEVKASGRGPRSRWRGRERKGLGGCQTLPICVVECCS